MICGIAVFTMPFCVERYDGFVISAIVFGFSSSFVILKTLIIVDLVGKKHCFYITFLSLFRRPSNAGASNSLILPWRRRRRGRSH